MAKTININSPTLEKEISYASNLLVRILNEMAVIERPNEKESMTGVTSDVVVGEKPSKEGADKYRVRRWVEEKGQKRVRAAAGAAAPEERRRNRPKHYKKWYNLNPSMRSCTTCGVRNTTQWRRGPKGFPTLCNACGLRYRTMVKNLTNQHVQAVAHRTNEQHALVPILPASPLVPTYVVEALAQREEHPRRSNIYDLLN